MEMHATRGSSRRSLASWQWRYSVTLLSARWPASLRSGVAPPSGQVACFPESPSHFSTRNSRLRGGLGANRLPCTCAAGGFRRLQARPTYNLISPPVPRSPPPGDTTGGHDYRARSRCQRTGLHPRRQHAGLPGQLRQRITCRSMAAARPTRRPFPRRHGCRPTAPTVPIRRCTCRPASTWGGPGAASRCGRTTRLAATPRPERHRRRHQLGWPDGQGRRAAAQVGQARLPVLVQDQSGGWTQHNGTKWFTWWAADTPIPSNDTRMQLGRLWQWLRRAGGPHGLHLE